MCTALDEAFQNPALTSLPCLETRSNSSEPLLALSPNVPQTHSDNHLRFSCDSVLLPKPDAYVESPQSCMQKVWTLETWFCQLAVGWA